MSKPCSETPRPDDWPVRLGTYLESRRDQPFQWAKLDCCMLAADWVRQCLGIDPAKGLRSKYRSEAGAMKLLKAGKGVRGLADTQFDRVKLAYAQRGDLVAYKDPGLKGPAWATTVLGILEGTVAYVATKDGLKPVKRSELMKTCWRVGLRSDPTKSARPITGQARKVGAR